MYNLSENLSDSLLPSPLPNIMSETGLFSGSTPYILFNTCRPGSAVVVLYGLPSLASLTLGAVSVDLSHLDRLMLHKSSR